MVTTVGTESSPEKLIENCILLEHDAIAAYDTVIERLENPQYREQIASFRADHLAHLDALREAAARHGIEAPREGDMKQMLTTGKVKLADMLGGDGAILKAMATNEIDTISAYTHACDNASTPPELRDMVQRARADEERHKAWMDQTAAAA